MSRNVAWTSLACLVVAYLAASRMNWDTAAEWPPADAACVRSELDRWVVGDRMCLLRVTRDELMTVPGVGPARADSLIRHRTSGFSNWSDVLQVPGVGPYLLSELQQHLTLDCEGDRTALPLPAPTMRPGEPTQQRRR